MADAFLRVLTTSPSGKPVRYYDDPSNMGKNLEATEKVIESECEDLGDNLMFFITSSKNRDAVVYVYVPEAEPDRCVRAFWHMVDKDNIREYGKGKARLGLNALEQNYFGFDLRSDDKGHVIMDIKALEGYTTLPARIVRNKADGIPAALVVHPETKRVVRIDSVYIQYSNKAVIDVDYVTIHATECDAPYRTVQFSIRK